MKSVRRRHDGATKPLISLANFESETIHSPARRDLHPHRGAKNFRAAFALVPRRCRYSAATLAPGGKLI
jgi:hypothetical protein